MAANLATVEDPGWRSARKGLLFAVVPMLGVRMAARSKNSLELMRHAWVSFSIAAVLIWVPVVGLWLSAGATSAVDGRTVALAVVGAGVALQLLAGLVVKSPIDDQVAEVRRLAQQSFFLRVAFAESAALVGFVGFVFTFNPVVYGAGFAIAMAGLADAAPTAAKLEQIQADLRGSGSEVELLPALVEGGLTR